jgi:hypothetical protein
LNDFLRKGSHWDEVKDNMEWYMKTFPGSVNVNGVISIYNVNNFYELVDYVNLNYPVAKVDLNLVDGMQYMYPKHLPTPVKEAIIKKLESKKYSIVPRVIDALKQPGDFKYFLENDQTMNNLRNETWYTHNDELYQLVKDYL